MLLRRLIDIARTSEHILRNSYEAALLDRAMCNPTKLSSRYFYVGNLPLMPGVFPDYPAPVVRNVADDREMVMMQWGMPPPPRTGGPCLDLDQLGRGQRS